MGSRIKHDGYRLTVRRDDAAARLYNRKGNDWTARLPTIAAAAELIKAKSFTIDGEAVVMGPDGLSRFEEAAHPAVLPRGIVSKRDDRARDAGA